MDNLVFLKLGGSLITDKTQASTPRIEVIERLVDEIANAKREKRLIFNVSGEVQD